MSNTLIVVENYEGQLRKPTFSSVTFANELSSVTGGGSFSFVVLGNGAAEHAQTLSGYGAQQVYVVDHPSTAQYTAQSWGPAVAAVAKASGATHVVMSASTQGKDLMPRVAGLLDAGMAADVIAVQSDGGSVTYKRPMWAGNVIATVAVDTAIHVVTVRSTEFSAANATGGASPVQNFDYSEAAPSNTTFVSFEASGGERPDLGEASVIVAGGRGLKGEDTFWSCVTPLADVLGAAIGATRAAVDSGYAPNDLQIGQTGRVVAPDLYFAVAISGAIQHLAGMKNSKCIVAINKDEDAPIFQVADYGLVADAFKAVPELTERIAAIKG